MVKEAAYIEMLKFLREKEEEDELVTLSDLKAVMDDILKAPGEGFSTKWIQKRLLEDFKDDIVIANNINGKSNVISFVSTASKILSDYHRSSSRKGTEDETMQLLRTAAKIIKSEVKTKQSNLSIYPTLNKNTLSSEYVTPSLRVFLEVLITISNSEVKRASLGQAIMQHIRPRSLLCPLQIGLAVQLHSDFGSRDLVDALSFFLFFFLNAATVLFK